MTEERASGHGTGADRSDLAGQYALGLLDGDERVAFERRLEEGAELRDEVARWQEHFAALGMNVDESELPSSVFGHLKRESVWKTGCLGGNVSAFENMCLAVLLRLYWRISSIIQAWDRAP